jgi:hypothetical protein
MTAIGVEPVLEAALEALDGGGQCRADVGPPPGAFSTAFEFGRWRGEMSSHCSMPEFYTRVCEPEDLLRAGEPVESPGAADDLAVAVSLPTPAGPASFRAVRTLPPRSLLRAVWQLLAGRPAARAWRAARGLAGAGVPAVIPACLTSRTEGLSHEDVLVSEDPRMPGTLRDLLGGGWARLSREARGTVVEAAGALLRELHRAGYCHMHLRPESIAARQDSDSWHLRLMQLEYTIYVGRLPRVARDILAGVDLGRFAGALGARISRAEALRFFQAYRRGFMEVPVRWRCLLLGVRLAAGDRGTNPWLRRLRVG